MYIAHNLNLVLIDTVRHIPEASRFFDIVGHVYTFFGASINRWKLIVSAITLKKLCPTRWSSRNDSLKALQSNYFNILQSLTEIILKSKNLEERTEAQGLKMKLENFEFIVLIVIFSNILQSINHVTKLLQSDTCDMMEAEYFIENATSEIKQLRTNYIGVHNEAQTLAEKWGVKVQFSSNKRQRIVKRHFDELSEDTRFQNSEEKFRICVFNAILDTTITQLEKRLSSFQSVVRKFRVIEIFKRFYR